jgi:hypothetical protein
LKVTKKCSKGDRHVWAAASPGVWEKSKMISDQILTELPWPVEVWDTRSSSRECRDSDDEAEDLGVAIQEVSGCRPCHVRFGYAPQFDKARFRGAEWWSAVLTDLIGALPEETPVLVFDTTAGLGDSLIGTLLSSKFAHVSGHRTLVDKVWFVGVETDMRMYDVAQTRRDFTLKEEVEAGRIALRGQAPPHAAMPAEEAEKVKSCVARANASTLYLHFDKNFSLTVSGA